ncbi:MAG: hypothetical protein ACTSP4_00350 [Candidatus Hodarchaeales archaeon]
MNKRITQIVGVIIAAIGIFIFSLGGTAGIGHGNENELFFIRAAFYVLGPVIAFIGVYLMIKDRRRDESE